MKVVINKCWGGFAVIENESGRRVIGKFVQSPFDKLSDDKELHKILEERERGD
jgi:hypothetical protein